ncbi:hypothetical protein HK097_011389, partial [Rhizophlyctis rosea]
IAVIFVAGTTLHQPHRYIPIYTKSLNFPYQPPGHLLPKPPDAFDPIPEKQSKAGYLCFSHAVRVRNVYANRRLHPEDPHLDPGAAYTRPYLSPVKNVSLVIELPKEEKEKLMVLHRQYWAGYRYEDGKKVSFGQEGLGGDRSGKGADNNGEGDGKKLDKVNHESEDGGGDRAGKEGAKVGSGAFYGYQTFSELVQASLEVDEEDNSDGDDEIEEVPVVELEELFYDDEEQEIGLPVVRGEDLDGAKWWNRLILRKGFHVVA